MDNKQDNYQHCIVCGTENKLGMHAEFYENENGEVYTITKFKQEHQSYPNRAHGGMICALLDELIGRAIWIYDKNQWGVTISINVKYRKPVPLDEDIRAVGKIVSQTSRTFTGEGCIYSLDGMLLAEATAVYMKLPLSKIATE